MYAEKTSTILSHQVRQEPHKAASLNGVRELALMPLTYTGTLARHDFSETRKIATELIRIFVIDDVFIILAEETLAIFYWLFGHNRGSRVSQHAGS